MKKIILTICTLALATMAYAQVSISSKKGDFNLRFIGRTNIDFGTNLAGDGKNSHNHYTNGVTLNDTRLGVSATFAKNWYAKIELSYADKALSFKDVFIGCNIKENHALQIGNFWEPYSTKPMGTLNWRFIEDSSISVLSASSRRLGIGYFYSSDRFNATVGAYSDSSADITKALNKGYAFAGKFIGRPVLQEDEDGKIVSVFHLGAAANYTNSPAKYDLSSCNLPFAFEKRAFEGVGVPPLSPECIIRTEAEFVYINRRWYIEGHYLANTIKIEGKRDLFVQGASLQGGVLLIGKQQNYDKKSGYAKPASPKNLELLARVDFLDLSYGKRESNIEEYNYGQSVDVTVGLNYYINKYVNAKINYVYGTSLLDAKRDPEYHALVGRVQFSF